jgi:glucosamine kinase
VRAAWTAAGRDTRDLHEAYVTLGLAGIDRPPEREAMREALLRAGLAADRLELVGDAWIALEGALPAASVPSGARVLLVAGTGSVAVAVDGATRVRVGGWGSRVGDEGSGAWLGLEAVRRTLRALDGRDAPGPLAAAVQETFGVGVDALVGRARTAAPAEFAALAPLVLAQAASDPVARALRDLAVGHLAELVATAAARAGRGPAAAVAFAGGVALALTDDLTRALPDGLAAAVRPAAGPPVAGAWSLARGRALRGAVAGRDRVTTPRA